MSLLAAEEKRFVEAISELAYCNPFLPERIAFERQALGTDFEPQDTVWNIRSRAMEARPNVVLLQQRAGAMRRELQRRLSRGVKPTRQEATLYRDLVLYDLYYAYEADFLALITGSIPADAESGQRAAFYGRFCQDLTASLAALSRASGTADDDMRPAHLFACFYQLRRAFHHIFESIVGASMPSARLRASVWESIFTHDMRRYRRRLYECMGDIAVLVTGPSGTGKELVARAIALSRYVPFDAGAGQFVAVPSRSVFAVNLSALSPALVESELFGHRRGAFTGATESHVGWLEVCGPHGTVFLDEIGDTDAAIQVKLLRALESRTFSRLGETSPRRFEGKLIAATNRDLGAEMQRGRFRQDLYYRLCSDTIATPSLQEQLGESPEELGNLVHFIAHRIVGEEEAASIASEALAWIRRSLGPDYAWPGNVRELEQCIRNVLVHKQYCPSERKPASAREELVDALLSCALTADELLCRYCTIAYRQTGSYVEASRRLELDRRTIKSKVDTEFLRRMDEP